MNEKQNKLLSEGCKRLGWQDGTFHQVLDVLSAAKHVVDTYHEVNFSGEYDKIQKALISLSAYINSKTFDPR
jgi:hypothetical protein